MSFRDSMHQTDLVDTLIYCDLAGHRPDAVVIGMEPADYHTMEIGLTPVCQARLPDLAGKVVEELRARGLSRSVRLEKRIGEGRKPFWRRFPSLLPSPFKDFRLYQIPVRSFSSADDLGMVRLSKECLQAAFRGNNEERKATIRSAFYSSRRNGLLSRRLPIL